MAYNITIEDNYLYIDDSGGALFDRPAKDVYIVKKELSSDTFTVYFNGICQHGFSDILWSDFTLDGVPFTSLQEFEDWKNANTGVGVASNSGNNNTPFTFTTVEATTDGFVAAGKRSVSMVFRGGGGSIDGVNVPNNFPVNIEDPTGAPTPQINYTVPTGGQQRIIILIIE